MLIPEGVRLKDKNVNELAEEIRFELDIETAQGIIEDFFDCNRIQAVVEQMSGAVARMRGAETISARLSASLPEETSQKETTSTGDMGLTTSDPTLSSEAGRPSSESASSASLQAEQV
ncbi:MAG: hypothetical protein HZA17_08840 [Nitrospirae bacterium]|nr:hypothetical protein [Nitrospirota bacterium]